MKPRTRRTPSPPSTGPAPGANAVQRTPLHPAAFAAVAVTLVSGVLVALHGAVLRWPFISDDFIFLLLDRTRGARDLFGAFDVVQNYFRPVGRELYFLLLQPIAGSNPHIHHAVNFAILVSIHALLLSLAWRLACPRAAVLASATYALLYSHRVLMAWVSCSQDLLATAFGLAAVLACERTQPKRAGAWFLAALLSKESVAPLPLVILLWKAWSEPARGGPWARIRVGLTRSGPLWITFGIWALLVIGVRAWKGAWAPGQSPAVADVALGTASLWEGIRSGLLTYLGLEQPWAYLGESLTRVPVPAPAMLLLGMIVVLAYYWPGRAWPAAAVGGGQARNRLEPVKLGAVWCLLGAVPPALAGHHFSAYYMSFGAVGFALAAGTLLAASHPAVVAALFVAAAELNVAANGVDHSRLAAPFDELPGVGYVTIARLRHEVEFDDSLHAALLRSPPPRGAVIYLSHAPKGASFATAGERAPKIWFDDPSLELTYIGHYDPAVETRARQFLRYDKHTRGFVALPVPLVDGIVESEALMARGAWPAARVSLQRTLALATPRVHDIERAELLNDLGLAAWRMGEKGAAREAWTAGRAEAPDHIGILLNLCALEADAGHFDVALVDAGEALRLEPDQPLALLYTARLERELGRSGPALEAWRRLVSSHPEFADSVARVDGPF